MNTKRLFLLHLKSTCFSNVLISVACAGRNWIEVLSFHMTCFVLWNIWNLCPRIVWCLIEPKQKLTLQKFFDCGVQEWKFATSYNRYYCDVLEQDTSSTLPNKMWCVSDWWWIRKPVMKISSNSGNYWGISFLFLVIFWALLLVAMAVVPALHYSSKPMDKNTIHVFHPPVFFILRKFEYWL